MSSEFSECLLIFGAERRGKPQQTACSRARDGLGELDLEEMSERFRRTVSLPAPLGWSGLQVPRECLLEWGAGIK